jgi:hypothetical protein
MINRSKNIDNVFAMLNNIQKESEGYQPVKKGFSQARELSRQEKLQNEKKIRVRKNPYELPNEINNKNKFQEKKNTVMRANNSATNIFKKLNLINISNLREETLIKIESIITNSIKNRPGQNNSNLKEEVRKKFIEFSNQIYLKAKNSREEEEIELINLQNQVLETYLQYFTNPKEIEDNLAKMNYDFINNFLMKIGQNKNNIDSKEISINNLLKLEYLTKKFIMYFEQKNIKDKKLIAFIHGGYLELRSSFINFSKKITEEAKLHPDKLLKLKQLQEKLLYIYNQYFDNDKKIQDNIKILNKYYSNISKEQPNLNTTNIFTNENEQYYLKQLPNITDNESFKALAFEVLELYISHIENALSILQQINQKGLQYNDMNKKFKNDFESLFKSLEKIYRLYQKILHFYLNQDFKNNDYMLQMINKLKNYNSIERIKSQIFKNKKN